MTTDLDRDISRAIQRHHLWSYEAIADAHDILGSWDKTLVACENAAVLCIALHDMAIVMADKTMRFWHRYQMGDDGRVGTYKHQDCADTTKEKI